MRLPSYEAMESTKANVRVALRDASRRLADLLQSSPGGKGRYYGVPQDYVEPKLRATLLRVKAAIDAAIREVD